MAGAYNFHVIPHSLAPHQMLRASNGFLVKAAIKYSRFIRLVLAREYNYYLRDLVMIQYTFMLLKIPIISHLSKIEEALVDTTYRMD